MIRLHRARLVRARRYRSWVETWKKPQRPAVQSLRAWKRQPEELKIRLVRFRIEGLGRRPDRLNGPANQPEKQSENSTINAMNQSISLTRLLLKLNLAKIKSRLLSAATGVFLND